MTAPTPVNTLMPPWAVMWGLAFALFFVCKLLTWTRERTTAGTTLGHLTAYFVAWPGMDPAAFLRRTPGHDLPTARVAAAVGRIAFGAALVWLCVPRVVDNAPLLAGWVGMTGLILMLHFGTFDLIAVAWQRCGADARPLMNAPTRAASLADFWGNRWNTAFHHLAARYVFKPLRRRIGLAGATLATFVVSGVVHDLVISVPAGAGHGLPTLYFTLQGAGVLLERAAVPRRLHRPFAWITVLAPLPWLFHEPFVVRVILPFLEVIR
jgi:hypothetical protein